VEVEAGRGLKDFLTTEAQRHREEERGWGREFEHAVTENQGGRKKLKRWKVISTFLVPEDLPSTLAPASSSL
jgi:hypothetical protein